MFIMFMMCTRYVVYGACDVYDGYDVHDVYDVYDVLLCARWFMIMFTICTMFSKIIIM